MFPLVAREAVSMRTDHDQAHVLGLGFPFNQENTRFGWTSSVPALQHQHLERGWEVVTHMSNSLMTACWSLQMPPPAKFALMTLAEWSNDRRECFLSVETLCRRTCCSRRTIIRAIAWLERGGFLAAERSLGRHTRYTVLPLQSDLFRPLHERDEPVSLRHPCHSGTGRASVDKYTKSVNKSVDGISQTGARVTPPPVSQRHPINGKEKKSRSGVQSGEQKLTKLSRSDRNRPVPKSEVDAFARKLTGMLQDSLKP